MMQTISLPIKGTDSEVAGTSSAISNINMENARKTDSPRVIFSPEVGGSQNVSNVKADSITHGTIMLKM
jgi:hypothetical protein